MKIPVNTKINVDFLQEQLKNYRDSQVVDLVKYGFPVDHDGSMGNNHQVENHKGATEFV